jgi:hypothetical protein
LVFIVAFLLFINIDLFPTLDWFIFHSFVI